MLIVWFHLKAYLLYPTRFGLELSDQSLLHSVHTIARSDVDQTEEALTKMLGLGNCLEIH